MMMRCLFFFKQNTAYEMRISDWSSDVCASDLAFGVKAQVVAATPGPVITRFEIQPAPGVKGSQITNLSRDLARSLSVSSVRVIEVIEGKRSEEHTSELQSLMRISYAVFCLKKKKITQHS